MAIAGVWKAHKRRLRARALGGNRLEANSRYDSQDWRFVILKLTGPNSWFGFFAAPDANRPTRMQPPPPTTLTAGCRLRLA